MRPRLTIIQAQRDVRTETFLRAQAERLPAETLVVHTCEGGVPGINHQPVLSQAMLPRVSRRLWRRFRGHDAHREVTNGYISALRGHRTQVVLAQYGPMGVAVQPACDILHLPLVVQFHGADASIKDTLQSYQAAYKKLFAKADAIVAVSSSMRNRLIDLGADPLRTHLNVYGVDTEQIRPAKISHSPPTFLAVGRFVEKKAPYLTLIAFAQAVRKSPSIRLRMIGDGVLLGPCIDMAKALGIESAVDFLGEQPSDVVFRELSRARGFVQHSIEASNGDCEGTPLAILEAGAAGIPVIATRHAGIPDVVVEGETGFLVNEKDVDAMANHIVDLSRDSDLASRLGAAARNRIESEFDVRKSVAGLWSIIQGCVR